MKRTIATVLVGFAAFLLVAAAAGVASREALADRVKTRDGRTYEGRVTQDDDEGVCIERPGPGGGIAIIQLPRDEVVEIIREKTPAEAFEEEFAKARTGDELFALAAKAKELGLEEQVRRCHEKTIAVDPDHAEAREALGYKWDEESKKWLAEDEWKRKQGYVQYEGEWLTAEEVEKRKEEKKQRLRDKAGKLNEKLQKVIEGVPWAEVQKGSPYWHENEFYVVLCNSTPQVGKQYADFMLKLRKNFDKIFGKYKKHFRGKSNMYIFRNAQEFYDMTHMEEGVGGFFFAAGDEQFGDPKYARLVAGFHGTFRATASTFHVLAHEGTHQYENIICEGTSKDWAVRPTWWVEGLAVYFGDGFRWTKNKKDLEIGIPRDRLSHLKQLIQSGNMTKLKELLRIPHMMFSGFYYSQGWGLCHYMLHRGEDKKGNQKPVKIGDKELVLAPIFEEFFKFVLSKPPDDLVSSYFQGNLMGPAEFYAKKFEELLGVDLDVLEEDYKKYILAMELPSLGKVSGNKFTSLETAFEISKPAGKDWKWNADDLEGEEAIRLENAALTALVRVSPDSNMMNVDLEKTVDQTEMGLGHKLESPLIDVREPIELGGDQCFALEYTGKEMASKNPAAAATGKVRDAEQKFRHVIVQTPKRIYHIVCQADKDRFEECRPDFEKILQAFKRLEEM